MLSARASARVAPAAAIVGTASTEDSDGRGHNSGTANRKVDTRQDNAGMHWTLRDSAKECAPPATGSEKRVTTVVTVTTEDDTNELGPSSGDVAPKTEATFNPDPVPNPGTAGGPSADKTPTRAESEPGTVVSADAASGTVEPATQEIVTADPVKQVDVPGVTSKHDNSPVGELTSMLQPVEGSITLVHSIKSKEFKVTWPPGAVAVSEIDDRFCFSFAFDPGYTIRLRTTDPNKASADVGQLLEPTLPPSAGLTNTTAIEEDQAEEAEEEEEESIDSLATPPDEDAAPPDPRVIYGILPGHTYWCDILEQCAGDGEVSAASGVASSGRNSAPSKGVISASALGAISGATRSEPCRLPSEDKAGVAALSLGEDKASCSCLHGNPCMSKYNCANWQNRFFIAKANGWKGHS